LVGWWWGAPIAVLVLIFASLFLITIGLVYSVF